MYLNFGIFRSSKWKALINVHQVRILNLNLLLPWTSSDPWPPSCPSTPTFSKKEMPSNIFKWERGGNCMSKHVTQPFSTCCFEDQFPWKKIIELQSARSLGVSQLLQFIVKTTLQSSSTQSSSFPAKSDDSLASQLSQSILKRSCHCSVLQEARDLVQLDHVFQPSSPKIVENLRPSSTRAFNPIITKLAQIPRSSPNHVFCQAFIHQYPKTSTVTS